MNFLDRLSKNTQISTVRKIPPDGAMRKDRRADITKLIVTFRNVEQSPNNRRNSMPSAGSEHAKPSTKRLQTRIVGCNLFFYHRLNCIAVLVGSRLCLQITLFLVQGGKWTPLGSLHEKQRTQIQDMLPQQHYNEKSSYF